MYWVVVRILMLVVFSTLINANFLGSFTVSNGSFSATLRGRDAIAIHTGALGTSKTNQDVCTILCRFSIKTRGTHDFLILSIVDRFGRRLGWAGRHGTEFVMIIRH